ncbi:MAG: VirB4 family type IV secretion/conjugal transfer ATPase [Pseudomonadota bacterium]|nr:VirB4 family type IV secretion/conjugal transfer ATPase [Pseudomonadota bacterium]
MSAVNRLAASRRELSVARQIPYAAHVAEGLIKTHAGDFVQVFRLGGASFESADDETLNNWHERLSVTWRNIASPNVALWTHVLRRRERVVATSVSATGFAAELERKYRERLAGETLMVNELYLALVYRPVAGSTTIAAAKLLSRAAKEGESVVLRDALETCEKLGQAVAASLARYEPERLGLYDKGRRCYSTLLEFFGILVNGEWQAMALPRAPLNEVIATTRPLFGSEVIEYRLPDKTRLGAFLGIKEYPTPTSVGMYNALLSAPYEFVLTQSFSFLTKGIAQGLLQRQYNRMANAGDFAVSQAEDLKDALDALTANEFVMGDHHLSLQVLTPASDARSAAQGALLKRLNDDVALARTTLADCGMTVAREDLALEAAFWAQLPGCFSLRPRKAPITSRNFAAMVPWHNYPTGRATGNHWGDALALLITSARSPYYFSLHASDPHDPDGGSRKDTGHTFICGPTGSGKTVLIGFLISMLSGQGATQVIFDKDQGLEILVRALGGVYLPLQPREPTGFNPLQLDPTPANVEFLSSWLRMLARGPAALTPRELTELDQALRGTLALDQPARRLSRLLEFTDPTRPDSIHARLARWCHSAGGDLAWVFDNATDSVVPMMTGHATVGFDVTHFLTNELIRGPVNRYLFHLVEQLLDGRRLVCWVDEFSNALADADFEHFADNAPKTWRKLNGVLCAATQTARGVLSSSIARTIVEQTATKVFFPNPEADAQDYIDGFGLTEREFKLLKEQLEPGSRMFLVKQGHDSVVCALDLKGFDAALAVISGRRSSVEEMHRHMRAVGNAPGQWLPHFLKGFERH